MAEHALAEGIAFLSTMIYPTSKMDERLQISISSIRKRSTALPPIVWLINTGLKTQDDGLKTYQ